MFVSVLYIKLLLSIYYFATIYCEINTAVMCVCLLFIGAQEQRGMNQSTVCVQYVLSDYYLLCMSNSLHTLLKGFSCSSHISFALPHFLIYNSSYKCTSKECMHSDKEMC